MTGTAAKTWQETPPRYEVDWPALITQHDEQRGVDINNISMGGILISLPRDTPFLEDTPSTISITFNGTVLEFKGRLVHYTFSESSQLFGMQFSDLNPQLEAKLQEWLKILEEKNTPVLRNSKRVALLKFFKNIITPRE